MPTELSALIAWLTSAEVIASVTLGTLALAAVSLAAVPILVVRLPADYFLGPRPPLADRLRRATALGRVGLVLKNLFGVIVGLLGIAMLVLPGQGLLTLLLALVLLDLPQKHTLEARMLGRPGIRAALDAIRRRFGKPPFEVPAAVSREGPREAT